MVDKSIYTKNQPKEISEGLQNFIDSMVEEIVLEGKPFDTQKKYLKKFCENERLDFDKLEADIITFIEILDSFKTSFSKLQVKLAEEKGRDCHITDETVKELVSYSSPKNLQEEIIPEAIDIKVPEPRETDDSDKPKKKRVWPWIVGIGVVAMIAIAMLLGISHNKSDIDTERYFSCQTVGDYRNYLVEFGHNAKYYDEAKHFIDNYMADSVAKTETQSKAKEEEALYNACTTIEVCDNYLKQYPQGRYREEVLNKKYEFEKQTIQSTGDIGSESNQSLTPLEKKVVGKHLLSLQWISWDYFGTCEISKIENGRYRCVGSQLSKENSDYLKLDGYISIVNENHLKFTGVIKTKVYHLNNGNEYVREGTFDFKATDGRKYWREQEMAGPDGCTDYIDIFFQKK